MAGGTQGDAELVKTCNVADFSSEQDIQTKAAATESPNYKQRQSTMKPPNTGKIQPPNSEGLVNTPDTTGARGVTACKKRH